MCLESLIIEIWRFVFSSLCIQHIIRLVSHLLSIVCCVCAQFGSVARHNSDGYCVWCMCLCVLIGLTLTSADCIIITNGQAVNAYEQQQWPTAFRSECILWRNFIRKYCGWTSIAWHEWLWAGSGYSLNVCSDRPTRRPMSWKCFFLACECSLADNTL